MTDTITITPPAPTATLQVDPAGGVTINVTTPDPTVLVVVEDSRGPAGTPGAAGDPGGTLHRNASGALSGHRLVWENPDSTISYADPTDLASAGRPVWLTTNAAADGGDVTVLTEGPFTEPTWSFTPGAALYLGPSGTLTETVPTWPSFLQRVATALTATAVYCDPQPPIRLEP